MNKSFFVYIGDVIYSIGNMYLFILNIPEHLAKYVSRPYHFWIFEHGKDFIFDNTKTNFEIIDQL